MNPLIAYAVSRVLAYKNQFMAVQNKDASYLLQAKKSQVLLVPSFFKNCNNSENIATIIQYRKCVGWLSNRYKNNGQLC